MPSRSLADELNLSELSDLPEALQTQPEKVEAENEFRASLDALTRVTKRHAVAPEHWENPEQSPRFNHTFRYLEPLTFSGRNRITSVISLPNYNTRNRPPLPSDVMDPLKVVSHFGDPTPVIDYLKSEGYPVEVQQAK
jgi:hypothetical protein